MKALQLMPALRGEILAWQISQAQVFADTPIRPSATNTAGN